MEEQMIVCPECGKKIPLTEALKHQLEEGVLAEERKKHASEIEDIRQKAINDGRTKAIEEFEIKIKTANEDIEAEKKRNKDLQENILNLTKEIRATRQEKDDIELKLQADFLKKEDKIREEISENFEERHRLKDLEKDKKIQDALKLADEYKRKLEQGSQQTQGEVLELDIEEKLRNEFPVDAIEEVKKGQRGADVKQGVVSNTGHKCGLILWETKNGQWQNGWVDKLKSDMRDAAADIGVLVSVNLPENVDNSCFRDGIWVTSPRIALNLATALRMVLIQSHSIRKASEGKDEKMEVLFNYLTGPEFKNRVETIVDSYTKLQEELEKEKRWYAAKWAREEKEIRSVVDGALGMYGDLQGITNRALPTIKALELPEADSES